MNFIKKSLTFLLIAAAIVLALGAHLLAGNYEWFHRYEVYAVAILVVAGVYFLGPIFFRLQISAQCWFSNWRAGRMYSLCRALYRGNCVYLDGVQEHL